MESRTSVRPRFDHVPGTDDGASTLLWPPREDADPAEVMDIAPEIAFAEEAASAGEARDAAFPQPAAESARTTNRTSPILRIVAVALALLAIIEGVVIVLQFTGRDVVRQVTAIAGGRVAPRNADAAPSKPAVQEASAVRAAAAMSASAGAPAAGANAGGGQLQVQTDRPGAAVIVDGQRRGTTPLTVHGLAPGPHQVRLISGNRSVEQTVVVTRDLATALVVPMGAGGVAAGWVDVVMPFEVQIFEQGRLVGTSAQSRLQFPAGEHRFEMANDAIGYRALHIVRVKPGEVSEVRPEVPTGLLNINATPWAEVWIDGRPAGTTPLGNVPVPVGPREVRFRHPEYGEQTRRVVVTTIEPARASFNFRP